MIDIRLPSLMEVVNFCSSQLKVLHPFVDCRKGIARIIIDGLQPVLNFMDVGALLPERFDHTSLFDFGDIDIMNVRNALQDPMSAKISRLSSMT
jgi:hypothetical protein